MSTKSQSQILNTHFGRNVKVLELNEVDVTGFTLDKKSLSNFKLFYFSTGTGNQKFNEKYSNTLVPFYGMEDDGTLIKAIMVRREVYDKRTLFDWQVNLLKHLKKFDGVKAVMLDDLQTLLDNYFNTPGEMLVSINHNEGFWKNNEILRDTILSEELYNINYTDITEKITEDILSNLLLFGKDEEQGFYYSEGNKLKLIGTLDKKKLSKNWSDTLKIIQQKRQDETIEERFNKKNKKGGKSKKYTKGKKGKKGKKTKKTKKRRVL